MTAYRPLQYRAAAGFPLGPWGRASLQGASLCTCEKLLERSEEIPSASRRFLCVSRATALNAQQVSLGFFYRCVLFGSRARASVNTETDADTH